MAKIMLLDSKKNFYKANMHCHSTLSDGRFTPHELKEYYKSHGYSILAITDHEQVSSHAYLDDEQFLTVTSSELAIKEFPAESTLKNFNMKVCHLNIYAKEQSNEKTVCYNSVLDHYTSGKRREELLKLGEYERVYSREGVNDIIKTANENGFFVCYNHPRWSLENYREYGGYEGLWGVEIFNTGCNESGHYEYDINVLDDMLRDGKRVFASSGDDNHNYRDDSFGTFVMVNAERLEYRTVIDALLRGDFYTSTAPEIYELYIDEGKVHIKTSAAAKICYSTFGRRVSSVTAEKEPINEAVFEIKDTDIYFRIDVIDEKGRRANTQPFFIENI